MTNEKAIAFFEDMKECTYGNLEEVEMAIKALENQKSIIAEFEKLKEEMKQERDSYDLSCINTFNVCIKLIDKYIAELKGE